MAHCRWTHLLVLSLRGVEVECAGSAVALSYRPEWEESCAMSKYAKKPISQREIAAIHAFYAPAYGKEAPEIPKARAPSRDLEHPEQVKIIKWWKDACKGYGLPEFALFAIPNAGQGRNQISGSRLKEEGVRAGVSDLFLAAPREIWHGAFCEVKSLIGSLSVPQSTFLYAMEMEGYRSECCFGHIEAIEFFKSYLNQA